ncbi:outer membrane protein assembly factor BamE [Pseudoalteromonas tunicata]|jgi:outer membrane protein assembly factor BamE|uniref:Outer membrane protein assembly factor BamE n=1 Tax=Pseudoalteromonas tunicata D2 TaxID=87626 RepID=A4CD42_9GAMM|nr:outer membrane protein assembly factor BamE [Pseudoalteromonas tunicata]ATC93991.1 outer membrane protein assembly factor BamE [Pseudoalteromonas tunicata]AXT29777.1 outer membrane protein assembly factor BamE [Pseudoalteromonas tunicata]EAR27485.1 hypothetical protein PTD2_15637 [Pseudoalteromonas tunicata D2]MDP4982790.1 outer membrane protein assembly factor BamE [Pseudoalteromonas tunicata]MDP5213725.1 outer membrane protein assembly factor BamE [Pseudoalteromonas tunicata]
MQWLKYLFVSLLLISASGCSNWVYRMNIPQGNFLEQKDIDKLRVEMTREQVIYVLGKPVAEDAFNNATWHYIYLLNHGRDSELRKALQLHFVDNKLVSISGDYEQPKDFNIPLEG